ncbi:MAG: 3-hydroxy-5-phosphonooxypentane-2,4-dione thiolase LsrF, partial [Bacteroidota bacterium]
MPEATNNLNAKDYGIGIPQRTEGFFLKGHSHLDWGMKDRLARIFNPKSGHTVMLAFDHGYIMGPTSGLERMDLTITPLIEYADCIMCTRGALRSIVPPTSNKPVSLRYSAGTTV